MKSLRKNEDCKNAKQGIKNQKHRTKFMRKVYTMAEGRLENVSIIWRNCVSDKLRIFTRGHCGTSYDLKEPNLFYLESKRIGIKPLSFSKLQKLIDAYPVRYKDADDIIRAYVHKTDEL